MHSAAGWVPGIGIHRRQHYNLIFLQSSEMLQASKRVLFYSNPGLGADRLDEEVAYAGTRVAGSAFSRHASRPLTLTYMRNCVVLSFSLVVL